MAKRPDPDDDDDFSELYKEYTGPPGSMVATSQEKAKANKRSLAGSDEEEEPRDPNAVPTDFTSREAKVWEAKSKATERNWKKRKEEEMICKICGESGHFTQGCPSTLGANRKSQDFFERVAARDKHVRALFTEKVIQRIEKDISCKIKMDEKFIIVSGKDRLILSKGVDAVHKIIKEEGDQRGTSSSHKSKSRSPERSPVGTQLRRSESQRSHPVSHNASHFHQRICRQDKVVEDRVREDVQKFSRGSPQASRIKCLTYSSFHEAYGSDGARGRSSHSKSPGRPPYASNLHNSYDGHNQSMGGYRNDGWDIERRGSDMQSGHQFEYPAFPKTLDELELDYTREAMELGRIRDKEEDEENYKHRETIREMRESYMKKLTQVRAMHAKQWEEFLQLDGQRHQHQAREQMSASGFGGYKQHNYSSYDGSSTNSEYAGTSYPMDSRGRYPNPMETYPSRAHDTHGGFQRQRREEFGKAYNRY
ncbi:CCHC-type domain-containing protein [Citrus sinensis]|uniref:CCHC-type domain-containing protein n=1 Tax=Citrus sinensis TaxID=2711 RepID=A0ACB8MN79_CITSI|nr:CCHC-type domain-containing protein [Citrus sinensis]